MSRLCLVGEPGEKDELRDIGVDTRKIIKCISNTCGIKELT
jgi:hypothetical protein